MKSIRLNSCFAFIFTLIIVFFPLYGLHAGPPGTSMQITIDNPVNGASTLYEFINLLINNIVLPLGGVIATLYIIYAGFLLVTARGDEKQIAQGKLAFLHAAIGTAILLGAWVITGVIENTIQSLTS